MQVGVSFPFALAAVAISAKAPLDDVASPS
jgi:hypothetical protein